MLSDLTADTERESFEEDYFVAMALASKIIEEHENNITNNFNSNNVHGANMSLPQVGPLSSNLISNPTKLQAISLPKFHGSNREWLQIYEIF